MKMCPNERGDFRGGEKTEEALQITTSLAGCNCKMPRRGESSRRRPTLKSAKLLRESNSYRLLAPQKKFVSKGGSVKRREETTSSNVLTARATTLSKMSLQEKLDKIRSPKLQNQHQVTENWIPPKLANNANRKQTAVVLSAVEGM